MGKNESSKKAKVIAKITEILIILGSLLLTSGVPYMLRFFWWPESQKWQIILTAVIFVTLPAVMIEVYGGLLKPKSRFLTRYGFNYLQKKKSKDSKSGP